MQPYQGFPISNFRTGFNEATEPWLIPRDAYQRIINAHLYRGVIEKVLGYRLYANMSYRNLILLTFSAGTTYIGNLTSTPTTSNFYGFGVIVAGTSAETFNYSSDASSTVINLVGNQGGTGTVQIVAPYAISLTFNSAPITSEVLFAWDSASPGTKAIMGIKQYYANNGSKQIMIFDLQRVGTITNNNGVLATTAGAIQGVSEIPHAYYQSAVFTSDGATKTYSGTLTQHPFVPGTVNFYEFTSAGLPVALVAGSTLSNAITDNGVGGFTGNNVTSGTINYGTGAFSITFTNAPASGDYFDITVGIYGNLFTGNISNFFSLVNYQYKAFFTNNVDPIFYYDGASIQYLNTMLAAKKVLSTSGVPTNLDITKTLHVFVNRDRLLLISPTVNGVQQVNSIFWSTALNALNFTNDEFLAASTSEPIRLFGYINSDLVVRFANSERVFRYTGDAFSPFRWDSTNNIWACDSPYSSINYDKWFSAVGKPAITYSDGVNVKRADATIPDFTQPTDLAQQTPVPYMNQTNIQQCYGERFDDQKEGWLCYNSLPKGATGLVGSDNVLAFNYLDETYAIYTFPLSCLGLGTVINVPTWDTTFTTWDEMDDTWDSYLLQSNSLVDLGGDQFDKVWELNNGNQQTDTTGATIPVLFDVITKNFNPFIEDGQLARLGYLDIYVSGYSTSTLRVQFYVNDQLAIDSTGNPTGYYQESILTFTTTDGMSPATNQTKVWKRIYVGSVGKVHTIRMYQKASDLAVTDEQPIYIHAIVPYFKPAGRIFN